MQAYLNNQFTVLLIGPILQMYSKIFKIIYIFIISLYEFIYLYNLLIDFMHF